MTVNTTTSQPGSLSRLGDLFSNSRLLSRDTISGLVAIIIISFIWQGVQRRKFYRGLPGPPHSFLFGHLPEMIQEIRKYPSDVHPAVLFTAMVNKYSLWQQGVVYIDTYPLVNDSIMITTTPEAAAQIIQCRFPRHHLMKTFYGRVVGLRSIVIAEGSEWKEMRKTFNPGFSLANIMTLMPSIVEECEIFVSVLSSAAKRGGYVESMDKLARGVTIDIIFRAVLGLDIGSQLSPKGNTLVNLIEAASMVPGDPESMNPLQKLNPVKWIMLRYYEWRIKRILKAEIRKRWELVKENQAVSEKSTKGSRELKLIVDLALKQYRDEKIASGKPLIAPDDDYLDILADNVKSFIFGGHDTTASTISWALYELSRNPDILSQVRQEHTSIFGPDLNSVSKTLIESPQIINQMPLTAAVIKETLRLFPPASALREAEPGATLTLNSKTYPLSNQLIYISHALLGRSPDLYPSPHTFLPQRFLPSSPQNPNPHAQDINPDSYRPFERGPRNCIGQELAMLELKVVLLLTARRFMFAEAYDEMASRRGKRGVIPMEARDWGGRAYAVPMASHKPKDGLPMWVKEE